MSLRVSVVVDGRADGAEAALGKTAAGFDAVARKAREAGAATDDGAKKATPALNRMGVRRNTIHPYRIIFLIFVHLKRNSDPEPTLCATEISAHCTFLGTQFRM